MTDLPKAAELIQLVSFLAPGFIMLGVRNRFKGGTSPELTTNLVFYAVASSAYYAAVSPFFHVAWGLYVWPWLWSFLQFFLVPLVIGITWMVVDQKEWFYRACEHFKLDVEHHIPTSWEWAFKQKRQPGYVTVLLKDGTRLYGTWTERSFASSSPMERDLYLERQWTVDDAGTWTELAPPRPLLICSKEVSAIEIIGDLA